MKENLDVFDFRLDQTAVSRLSSLDRGEAQAADSDKMGHAAMVVLLDPAGNVIDRRSVEVGG